MGITVAELAKEFAEYSVSDLKQTLDEETYNKLVRQASSGLFDVRYVLFFILKHYFIAPKDKVRAEYEFNDQAGLATAIRTGEMANKYILKRDLIETIFGEEAIKEIENENNHNQCNV